MCGFFVQDDYKVSKNAMNDKSVVRVGYARFVVPASLANPERDTPGEIDLGGFAPRTNAPTVLAGRYTNLGSAVTIDEYDQRTPISDRIDIWVQRQLPGNFVSRDQYDLLPNLGDPRLSYTYKNVPSASVSNPFYNYGTKETFPGTSTCRSRNASPSPSGPGGPSASTPSTA